MVEKKKTEYFRVMSPKFRVSFPAVFEAKSFQNGPPTYSVVMLFDEDADLSELKKAATQAKKSFFGDNPPKNLKNPFRDCGEKIQFGGYEEGMTFVTATSKDRPGLCDKDRQDIIDREEFYAGCYARATLSAAGYDFMGNKGVKFYLSNIQKLGDGDPLSGKSRAQDDFDVVQSDDSGDISDDSWD